MDISTTETMNGDMKCLIEQMGRVDAEVIILIIFWEKFDYTKWQRGYFDTKAPEKITKEACQFEESYPFTGNAIKFELCMKNEAKALICKLR